MSSTIHSEYLKLKRVFIKPVMNSFISDELLEDQWKEHNFLSKPDFGTSLKEYDLFKSIFNKEGIEVDQFPYNDEVSMDSIYCRDASIATNFGMIICNMGKTERINEPLSHRKFYERNHIPILAEIESPGTLEGGDVVWLDENTLAVGHTYRTNKQGIEQLKKILEPRGVRVLEVQLPHYKGENDVFHLMSIISPIDKNLAVVYSPLMPIKFRNELIERGFKFIEVPDEEFESMGCNVLAIAPKNCIMVESNPKTFESLIKEGCEVHLFKGDEISVKGGGGPTCLTRPLLRSK